MKNKILSTFLLAGILIAGITPYSYTQDWPQWRGMNRDGKVSGFIAPAVWPKALNQSWKVTVGLGDAGPVLAEQKLYVFTRQDENEVLRCLDASTGKELWKDSYTTGKATGGASSHPGPRSTPAVADGKIVVLGVTGILSCLDANSGKLLWRNSEFENTVPEFFTSMSPLIIDGMCIAHLGGPDNGRLFAFDLATGIPKWKWVDDGPTYSSPIVITAENKKLLVVHTDQNLIGLTLSDGKLQWQIPTPLEKWFYCSATPIIDGQVIIYTSQGTGTRARKIVAQGEGFGTTELWHNPELGTSYNTPVLKDGWLYGLSTKGKLFCINARDGKTAWIDDMIQNDFGSVVDAGSVMIALSRKSELIIFKPDPGSYSEIGRYKVAETPVYSHPVISGKRFFVKDSESLILWTLP